MKRCFEFRGIERSPVESAGTFSIGTGCAKPQVN